MMRDFLASLHWSALPIVTMFLFMSVFFGAVIWVFRKGSTEIYNHLGNLPLDDERNSKNG